MDEIAWMAAAVIVVPLVILAIGWANRQEGAARMRELEREIANLRDRIEARERDKHCAD